MGVDTQVKYCDADEKDADTPPALLVGETRIGPIDGVIVSSEELIKGLNSRFREDELIELHRIFNAYNNN